MSLSSLADDAVSSPMDASQARRAATIDSGYDDGDDHDYQGHDDSGIDQDKDRLCNAYFEYPPIDPTTQIRLLQITYPSGSTGTIKCDLQIVEVSQLACTDYTALSYSWGEARTERDIHEIEIGNQTLWVRTNLFHFLSSVSETDVHLPIYIDAVCLDQRSDSEKGHQVKLMSQIYANANMILAWVGLPHADQHDHLDALSRRLGSASAAEFQWDVSEMISLSYLCSRQFWRRLWIVQELLLAKNITILCGTWRFPWKHISRLARLPLSAELLDNQEQVEWWEAWTFPCPESFQQQRAYQDRLFDGWQSALRLLHHRRKWTLMHKYLPYSDAVRTQGWPFHRAVKDFRFQQCRDRRDKVYALIGLLDGEGQAMITSSYESPLEDVFMQATAAGLVSLRREAAAEFPGMPDLQYMNRRFCDSLNDILRLPEEGREQRVRAAVEFADSYHLRQNTIEDKVCEVDVEPMVMQMSRTAQRPFAMVSRSPLKLIWLLVRALLTMATSFGTFGYLAPKALSSENPLAKAFFFPAVILSVCMLWGVFFFLEWCYRLCYKLVRGRRTEEQEGLITLSAVETGS